MPIYEAATIDEAVQLGLADLGWPKTKLKSKYWKKEKKVS